MHILSLRHILEPPALTGVYLEIELNEPYTQYANLATHKFIVGHGSVQFIMHVVTTSDCCLLAANVVGRSKPRSLEHNNMVDR